MRFDTFFGRVFPNEEERGDNDEEGRKSNRSFETVRMAVIRFLHTNAPARDAVYNPSAPVCRAAVCRAAVCRADWSNRDICPIIKWLDDKNIPYVYSAWENYYRSNDAVWCISQHGHVRSYRASRHHTYECAASPNMVCRVTSEMRSRCAEAGLARHPIFSSSELALGYKQLRQHRVYRIADGVELHLCLHSRRYNVWMDVDVRKFHRLAPRSQKTVFRIIDRCSNHLRNCVATSHASCTDAALSTLQRRFTGMLPSASAGRAVKARS